MVIPIKVSVIIPTYNMASTITAAIESVKEQLFNAYELIIVDDGSTDKTRNIVNKYLINPKKVIPKIKYIYQKNQGRGAAINTGVKASRSEYITFLDADDVLTKESLRLRAEFLDNNPHIGMVYADAFYTDRNGKAYKRRKSQNPDGNNLLPSLFSKPITPIIGPTIMLRRSLFNKVLGYNPIYRRNQDQELHIRILRNSNVYYISEPVLYYKTYLRRSNLFKYKLNGLKSWYMIYDTYINGKHFRIYLKIKRTFFEFLKLLYEYIHHRK